MDSDKDFCNNNSKVNKNQPCLELRFLIPSKVAGSIIGKSGENIRSLRQSFVARINVSDNSGPERILSLEADLDIIFDILRQSLDKIDDYVQLPRSGFGDVGEYTNNVDLRMLVNQSLVGALIGRGGGRINDLRERCDLRVLKVYQNVCPESTDRVVQMVGSISPILDCITKVVDLCKETPVREPKINYEAQNYDPVASPLYGGWSPNQARIDLSADKFGTSLGFSRPTFNRSPLEPYDHAYNTHYRDADVSFDNIASQDIDLRTQGDSTQTMSLPNKLIGAIIGPGGSRIQQIRKETEAQITIASADRNSQDRTVTISGSVSSVRRAQNMIYDCIDKYGKQQ